MIEALNEIVSKEPRWGFWKCFDRLREVGKPWNYKRVDRVYRKMRLNQKRRTKQRLATRPRQPMIANQTIYAVWAQDLMHDTLCSGRASRTCDRRNRPRLRSSRLPAIKTLKGFDFSFQPSIKHEQAESLHELGFIEHKENVVFVGPQGI